jgi:hypothetical protein
LEWLFPVERDSEYRPNSIPERPDRIKNDQQYPKMTRWIPGGSGRSAEKFWPARYFLMTAGTKKPSVVHTSAGTKLLAALGS